MTIESILINLILAGIILGITLVLAYLFFKS